MGIHNKFVKATVGATLAVSSVPLVAPMYAQAATFLDVPESAYYYDAVHELAARGIVTGYGDQMFKPNEAITRGQLAKILAGILELDTRDVANPGFTDVSPSNPYYGAIAALTQAGIINGYEDQTFRMNEPLQRNHLAKMLVKAFHLQSPEGATMPLTDVHKDYQGYILALYTNGITTGKTATKFDGRSHVTRGQLAAFVIRAEAAVQSMENEEVEEEPIIDPIPPTEPTKPTSNLTFTVSIEGLAEVFSTDTEIEVVTSAVIARMYKEGDVVKITFVSEEAIPKESFKVKIHNVEYEFTFNKEGNKWVAKEFKETVSSDSEWEPAPSVPNPPPTPSPPSTISVTVKTPPTKEIYYVGESLDLTGLAVNLQKSNGTEEEVNFTQFALKGITVSPTQGTPLTTADTAVLITVNGRTVSQPIIVNPIIVPPNPVTAVIVKTPPTKETYIEGELLELAGLEVTLQRANGTTEDVAWVDFSSKGITTNPINGAVLTTSDTAVTIFIDGQDTEQLITVTPQ